MKNMHVRAVIALLFMTLAVPAMADQTDPQLDALFEKLKTAPDYEDEQLNQNQVKALESITCL